MALALGGAAFELTGPAHGTRLFYAALTLASSALTALSFVLKVRASARSRGLAEAGGRGTAREAQTRRTTAERRAKRGSVVSEEARNGGGGSKGSVVERRLSRRRKPGSGSVEAQ